MNSLFTSTLLSLFMIEAGFLFCGEYLVGADVYYHVADAAVVPLMLGQMVLIVGRIALGFLADDV